MPLIDVGDAMDRRIGIAAWESRRRWPRPIPTYKLRGHGVLSFAGWKAHYSLYAANDHLVAAFEDYLAQYKVNKATIRFPLSQRVPVKLIERIARFRAKEAATRTSTKRAKPKRRSLS